jgi:hypothetical protein
LKTNPSAACEKFNFYDEFSSVKFEFVAMTDDESYMLEQPEVEILLISANSTKPSDETGVNPEITEQSEEEIKLIRQAKDLIVNVTIPASEQVKIPVWTDIKILMTIQWSSSQFTQDASQDESLVF